MASNFTNEIKYKTARSGGSGGQNVNKVETMVEGYWNIAESLLFDDVQKALITEKLSNKITSAGLLLVKSQTSRTQLANKIDVNKKMHALVKKALFVPKKRKPTQISKAVMKKRLDSKKIAGTIKADRKKVTLND